MGLWVLWWPLCCSNVSWICITMLLINTTGWQNRCWWKLKKQIERNFWKIWKQEKFWRKHLQAVSELLCSRALRVLVWDRCCEEGSGLQALGFWKRSFVQQKSAPQDRSTDLCFILQPKPSTQVRKIIFDTFFWKALADFLQIILPTSGEWRLSQR